MIFRVSQKSSDSQPPKDRTRFNWVSMQIRWWFLRWSNRFLFWNGSTVRLSGFLNHGITVFSVVKLAHVLSLQQYHAVGNKRGICTTSQIWNSSARHYIHPWLAAKYWFFSGKLIDPSASLRTQTMSENMIQPSKMYKKDCNFIVLKHT